MINKNKAMLIILAATLLTFFSLGALQKKALADNLAAAAGCYLIDSNFVATRNDSVCASGKDSDGVAIDKKQNCYYKNVSESVQAPAHIRDCTQLAVDYPETIPAPPAGSPQAPAGCYLNGSANGVVTFTSAPGDCKGNGGKDQNGQPADLQHNCYYDTDTASLPKNTYAPVKIDCGVVEEITPAASGVNGPSFGATDCKTGDVQGCVNGSGLVQKVINPLIKVFTLVFGVVAVIMFIVGGIVYASSEDNPQKVSLAKKIIINTVLALVAYAFLYAFLDFILPGGLPK